MGEFSKDETAFLKGLVRMLRGIPPETLDEGTIENIITKELKRIVERS
jgi:hypothetical protein